ncbi:MAG: translesion DNA synthesis-associated protein ImuA [Zoogloea sp.]|nr:translesion DNA synthesis-associated protein ImuA [Zoogloea sp.]
MPALAPTLARLDGIIWRGDRLATGTPGRSTGHASLDAVLPGGGWPDGALIELFASRPGIGELALLAPALANAGTHRWNAWIAPPWLPYAPALAAAGVPLSSMLVVRAPSAAHARWAARQALASRACAQVLLWLGEADNAALRRLQLAAEESATPLFLFRPADAARQPSPAVLRLALRASPNGLSVEILKRRGPALARPIHVPLARPAGHAPSIPQTPPSHALVFTAAARSASAGIHSRIG